MSRPRSKKFLITVAPQTVTMQAISSGRTRKAKGERIIDIAGIQETLDERFGDGTLKVQNVNASLVKRLSAQWS